MTPYLRAANVKDGALDLSDVKEMNFEPAEQQVFSLGRGDILVTEGSGSLSAVGASAVWNEELEGMVCFQNTLLRLRPRPSTDGRYLAWWCRHAFADGLFASVATGANIFHLSASRVRSLPLTYAPLKRQRAIADFLDTETARIDAAISKKRHMIDLLRSRLVGARHECYERTAIIYGVVPLRRLVTCLDARRIPLNREERSLRQGGYPYWGAGSIVDWIDDYLFDETLVLLGEDGAPFFDTDRDVSFVINEPIWVNNHVHVLQPRAGVDAEWLGQMLNTVDFSLWITGSTRDKLTQDEMTQILMPAAPEQIQRQWAEALLRIVRYIDHLSELLRRQLELLREHRQALITAAVTGELDIQGSAA